MRIVMFYHSLVSDWNHGNAHFLRGIATELQSRGHDVAVFEPRNSWSRENLTLEYGQGAIKGFQAAYPTLEPVFYDAATLDPEAALDGADLVLVHEWNDYGLVRRLGEYRARHPECRLLFHDTHHRMVTEAGSMSAYDLSHYDGVLAYGAVLRELYQSSGLAARAWTWHEAADTRVFHPWPRTETVGDLVWIGNWGDDERTAELEEFLIEPARKLSLKTRLHGVRYPEHARAALARAGIEYAGWVPNHTVPQVFSTFRCTVHVPRRPYVAALPGIPTIRVFEALAGGIPLVCSPWDDVENLFRPGTDFLMARNGAAMTKLLREVVNDEALAADLAANGLHTIRTRHTCAHRVDELLAIHSELTPARPAQPAFATVARTARVSLKTS